MSVTSGLPTRLTPTVRSLPACNRIWPADDLPLASLVNDAITDLELHRQDADLRRLLDVGLLRRPVGSPSQIQLKRRCIGYQPLR